MATVRVSDVSLTRIPAVAPAAKVRISDIALIRVPPAAPAPRVRISGLWITRGFEPPVTEGGSWVRVAGTWGRHQLKVRISGGWI